MLKRLFVVLTLLTGCRSKPAVPTSPGTSIPLTFPVVLVGQGSFDVRDDLPTLTSATFSSGLNFLERKIVDSTGAIYEVKQATSLGKAKAWWLDMGTSRESYFLELQKTRNSSLDTIKRLLLEELESGILRGEPKPVARVKGFASVAELIEGCRTSWDWNH